MPSEEELEALETVFQKDRQVLFNTPTILFTPLTEIQKMLNPPLCLTTEQILKSPSILEHTVDEIKMLLREPLCFTTEQLLKAPSLLDHTVEEIKMFLKQPLCFTTEQLHEQRIKDDKNPAEASGNQM